VDLNRRALQQQGRGIVRAVTRLDDATIDVATARRRYRLCLIAIAVALAIYSAIVIRDFSGPIGDHVESFLYEYLSY
jgi:hypothetical protein